MSPAREPDRWGIPCLVSGDVASARLWHPPHLLHAANAYTQTLAVEVPKIS